jgi:hypothetical protein
MAPAVSAEGGGNLLGVIERLATNPDLNVDVLERLLNARRLEEDRAAKRDFFAALAAAKGEFGPIVKTRLVDYAHKDDRGRTTYKHEDLADISAVVDPVLARHGLSYRHRTVQGANSKVTVTCILSHDAGHSEENSLDGIEDKSGQKNANQSIASTVTYLQRYTLKQALGIAAGRDDDGRYGGASAPKIGADEIRVIEGLIAETGRSQATLMRLIGVDEVADMTIDQFTRAREVLELAKLEKRRAQTGNG